MGGLIVCGFTGPWRWQHDQWEGAFYRSWNAWEPHTRTSFPALKLGGSASGRTSQAREILWELKRTAPFYEHDKHPLTQKPLGLTPREYLDTWCDGATADEWFELATAFLREMSRL